MFMNLQEKWNKLPVPVSLSAGTSEQLRAAHVIRPRRVDLLLRVRTQVLQGQIPTR